jgi:hypothetical protein
MSRIEDKTFSIHDTTVSIWREHLGDPTQKVDWLMQHDWDTHEEIRMMLVRDGFSFHQDPRIKRQYRCLAKKHHTGKKQDLHFKSELAGRHHSIVFYEDVIRDNQNGGRYTFDKLGKMPYQTRLKAKLAIGKVTRLLLSLGFTSTTEASPALAIDRCMIERESLGRFQGIEFYAHPPRDYNSKDAEGNLLRDGQIRYFWDYKGRLGRGVVMHHINNMWWVIASPYTLLNIASFELFDWKPGMPLKRPSDRDKKLRFALKAAIDGENYERAIILRELLKASAPADRMAA